MSLTPIESLPIQIEEGEEIENKITKIDTTTKIKNSNIEKLRTKLGKLAKITITDGRSFIGTFTCADPQGNVVLYYATEYRRDLTRRVGSIIIGKKHIVKFEVEKFNPLIYN